MNVTFLVVSSWMAGCVDPAATVHGVEHTPDAPGRSDADATDAPGEAPPAGIRSTVTNAGGHLHEQLADAASTANAPSGRTDGPAWEAFYDPDAVHTVHIELSDQAWSDIEADGRTWVPAVVTVDDIVFPNAGVHRKGSTTYQGMRQKPSFKIKLRGFGDGPHLAGLDRMTLNNMVSDPTQARENIALRLWRALGQEATRASWAVVTVNDTPYGLYSNIESLDDEWLQRRYDAYKGDLWEANDDADFTESGLPWWELGEGTGESGTLEALAAVVDDGVDSFDGEVGPYLDVDQFLHYWAACLATGAVDGYPFHLNDAFVYADPGDNNRLDMIPWGMDEAWSDKYSSWTEGELAAACRHDPVCDERRREVLAETLDKLDALDVAGMIADSYATSAALTADDPRRPYAQYEVDAARAELAARITGWSSKIRSEDP